MEFSRADAVRIGVAVVVSVGLGVVSSPAVGIIFGVGWAAGWVNGKLK